jgi:Ran GTPase-activating protein (RanGAP) involved in mRNA processing and transport
LLLDNNKFKDKGAHELSKPLRNMRLVELNLGFNEICCDGITDVISSLETNSFLRILSLSGNQINNQASKVLSNYLLNNNTLTSLFLDRTSIGSVGEKYISAGIATNKTCGLRHITGIELGFFFFFILLLKSCIN